MRVCVVFMSECVRVRMGVCMYVCVCVCARVRVHELSYMLLK